MVPLSTKACLKTTKRNSVCSEIAFSRSSSLTETSQLILFDAGFCWEVRRVKCGVSPDFWVVRVSLWQIARESVDTVRFGWNFLAGELVGFSVVCVV